MHHREAVLQQSGGHCGASPPQETQGLPLQGHTHTHTVLFPTQQLLDLSCAVLTYVRDANVCILYAYVHTHVEKLRDLHVQLSRHHSSSEVEQTETSGRSQAEPLHPQHQRHEGRGQDLRILNNGCILWSHLKMPSQYEATLHSLHKDRDTPLLYGSNELPHMELKPMIIGAPYMYTVSCGM